MARQLWLLRHAEAEPHGTREDSGRRLTERGERQARAAGAALAQLCPGFDLVLYSPKVRAAATAELAAEAWEPAQREVLAEHAPLGQGIDAREALELAAGLGADGRLLLVGHEPWMSALVGELTGGRIDMKKGGVAAVRLEGVRGELAVLLRPREIALLAGLPVDGH